jgi:glutamate dehydrogenase
MTATSQAKLADALSARLTEGALPGELAGFGAEERAEAAAFVAQTAAVRVPGRPALALEPLAGTEAQTRRMRLAIVNDDMPFLVDSVAAAIGEREIPVERILHPVVPVERNAQGQLVALGSGAARESMIYIELDRVDARDRRALTEEIEKVLADVRAAVGDWRAMQAALAADAAGVDDTGGDAEGAHLLRWFLDRHFTLLGHERWHADGRADAAVPLGIARHAHEVPILAERSRRLALDWFAAGNAAPLLLKSSLISPVHRRAPLDLVIVPLLSAGRATGLSIHAGLWTSAALNAPPRSVPVLRARLAAFEAKFGFDPVGHTGKALTHAFASLPHDLVTAFAPEDVERVALTSMGLADRPRPRLLLARSPLGRQLFAFVWVPRDDFSTARRVAIGEMLAEAANGRLLSWTVAVEGVVALLRFTIDLRGEGRVPEEAPLDARLVKMVRGWAPSVEAALSEEVGEGRAARLTLRHAGAFPPGYRTRATAEEAARDIVAIAALADEGDRIARFVPGAERRAGATRLKVYRHGGALALSDVVPALENFGFRVLEEQPTALADEERSSIHDFALEARGALPADCGTLEEAVAQVLEGRAENDGFNRLILDAGLSPRACVLFRAWFRYLRQAGQTFTLATVVDTLARTPDIARALIARFEARHDPAGGGDADAAQAAILAGLDAVTGIDDDRVLRAFHAVIEAVLRTNAFTPAAGEALAFKLDSARIPGLPRPLPWREVWVYSPRVEGIHLRAGPVARGGLRWSDRRDDFRTEILGLMKAQRVKNAVIVPTGAKGGFYAKQLPDPADRDAWMAEGTEAYRIFIRTLLSITDNIVAGAVVHPAGVVPHDGEDPYFVVAADKGTATFSDVANAIALEHGFWLGDAFASGGSQGYDHKAMGITAKGAWVSVQRHFAERGVDVQTQPIRVVGCGDMSGDVFGNGMLLSKVIRLVAAFDHRHIFLDPDPDPAASFAERARLSALPRSSWADYAGPISAGGGVHSRAAKSIRVTPQVAAALDIPAGEMEPAALIAAILKAPVDLVWFGGIGTYVKAAGENNAGVGDPANDRLRVDAEEVRAVAIGEGANLGVTQAGRIAFAARGGRINTDFIDNSAGVDCSDNEVNIKIALNREMAEGRLAFEDRNTLLAAMTDDVAHLVLEDNRLQTLALSLAERGGARVLPSHVRLIEIFEEAGRLDRRVEGLAANAELLRRAGESEGGGRGLTRPELAVLLATAKLALQDAIEHAGWAGDATLSPDLHAAFPRAMRERFASAIDAHRLRGEIVATKLANRIVNRIGLLHPFELAEEEGVALAEVAAMFVVAERQFGLAALWTEIERAQMPEDGRLALFDAAAVAVRSQVADLLRVATPGAAPSAVLARLAGGMAQLEAATGDLLLDEARAQSGRIAAALEAAGAPAALIAKVVRLFELDGAVGLADLGERAGEDAVALARAFTRLGQALGLDWAQGQATRIAPADPWERLLVAGLARDFEQLRLDFLARGEGAPEQAVERWLTDNGARVAQFRALVDRARDAATPSAAMLAQVASQARVLLGR